MPDDLTLFERIKKKLYNNKVIVIISFIALLLTGLSTFVGSLVTLKENLFGKKGLITNESPNNKDSVIEKMPTHFFYSELKSKKEVNIDFVRIEAASQNPWERWSNERLENSKIKYLVSNPSTEILMERRLYNLNSLKKAEIVFECERHKKRIDPNFDITLFNNEATPVLIHKIGIQVLQAGYRMISGGDMNSNFITVKGRYSVEFPLPKKIKINTSDKDSFIIDLNKNKLNYDNRYDIPEDSIIDESGKKHPNNIITSSQDYEYAELPITALVNISNPVLIEPHRPFRFTLKINKSKRFRTDALIRIAIQTNEGFCKSEAIYLIEP